MKFFRRRTSKARSAAVYKYARHYVVASQQQVPGGPIWEVRWKALPLDSSDEEIGTAVMVALNEFREARTPPARIGGYRQAIAEDTGLSASALVISRAQLVAVDEQDGALTLNPHRNGGVKGDERGFHEMSDDRITVGARQSAVLGRALLNAFAISGSATSAIGGH